MAVTRRIEINLELIKKKGSFNPFVEDAIALREERKNRSIDVYSELVITRCTDLTAINICLLKPLCVVTKS